MGHKFPKSEVIKTVRWTKLTMAWIEQEDLLQIWDLPETNLVLKIGANLRVWSTFPIIRIKQEWTFWNRLFLIWKWEIQRILTSVRLVDYQRLVHSVRQEVQKFSLQTHLNLQINPVYFNEWSMKIIRLIKIKL